MGSGVKKCSKCTEVKDLDDFGKQTSGPMGRKSQCKLCEKIKRDNREYVAAPEEVTEKQCNKCQEFKLLELFHKNKSGKYGVGGRCRSCVSEYGHKHREGWTPEQLATRQAYQRRWFDENGRDAYDRRKAKLFGITVEQLRQKFAEANGHCQLCGEETDTLFLDHNHKCCPGRGSCGKCVRDLLCGHCNLALGQFRDRPALMRQAADYVERWA